MMQRLQWSLSMLLKTMEQDLILEFSGVSKAFPGVNALTDALVAA